jgi:mannosyltransferase OCH1-like enzyme
MNTVRYVAARLIKIIGNGSKLFWYFFHYLAPNRRFELPHHSGPLIKARTASAVPRIIWQTNFTSKVTLAVYVNYLFNRLISPTYEYRFMDNDEAVGFIAEHWPREIVDAYTKLQIGAAKADFWRLLALQKFGGVYIDLDAHMVWPLGYVIGKDRSELYLRVHEDMLTNYFIASKPDNPHLQRVIDAIMRNIANPPNNSVFLLTGPGVLDEQLRPLGVPADGYRYTCIQGTFTNEFFQYVDHRQGKWHKAEKTIAVVGRESGTPETK